MHFQPAHMSTHSSGLFPNDRQILSCHEAKSHLRTLKPGTEEHRQLQDALIRKTGIAGVIRANGDSYKVDTISSNCALQGGFGSSEHYAIGEAVKLQGLEPNPPCCR